MASTGIIGACVIAVVVVIIYLLGRTTAVVECDPNKPCPTGQACVSGKCVVGTPCIRCGVSAPCSGGQQCVGGACVAPA